MNVRCYITMDYEKRTLGERGENEPKTNPNEPNYKKAKMNVKSYITRDYEKIRVFGFRQNKPKTNPIKPNL